MRYSTRGFAMPVPEVVAAMPRVRDPALGDIAPLHPRAPADAEAAGDSRPTSWAGLILRGLLSNPSALIGFALLGLLVALALLAPLLARDSPNSIDVDLLNQEPSGSHPFGTDYLGRDMWARVLYGGQTALPAGLGVLALAFGAGVPLGLLAAAAGGALESLIMRLVDVFLAIPGILLAIGVVAILGPDLRSAVIAIGIANSPGFVRVARGAALQVAARDYVEAARAQSAGTLHVVFRHLLPNAIDPLIVLATLQLGNAILATSALSFLGLGTQLPASDWGTLLSQGYEHMFQSWSEVTFPGLAICLAVLGVNLLGDGLVVALNPRLSPH
jgi:peptide/nickel transport system permease protein